MRFIGRSLVGLFLLGATLGLLAVAGQMVTTALRDSLADKPAGGEARERVFAVNVIVVESSDIQPVLSAFGEIRSRRRLELRASASGTVVEIAPEMVDGGAVTAGQILLRIDPADAQSAVDVAGTELSEAEAELDDAGAALVLARDELEAARRQAALQERALARQRDLRDRGVGTEAAVEAADLTVSAAEQAVLAKRQALADAETRESRARTGLARARIALAEAERGLADTELRAEFDGVLDAVSVVEGGLLSDNERVAELIDPLALEVAFRVSTLQYARLLGEDGRLSAVPVRAKLDISGVDITARGHVSRESAAVGAGLTGRRLYAVLDRESARGLRPGDFVTVEIDELVLTDVVRLPATAVDSESRVLVLGADNRLESRAVSLLRKEGNSVILRAPGLDGAEVVAERTPLIGEGIRVEPIRPGRPQEAAASPMIVLSPEHRARLIAFVEASDRLPEAARARLIAQLNAARVPASVVERLEARMGG